MPAGASLAIGGLGLATTAYGAYTQAQGAKAQGKAQDQEDSYEAVLDKQKANEDMAAATRRAQADQDETALTISKARNNAGGDGSDPTVLNLIGQLAGQGAYKSDSDLYEGKVQGQNETTAAGLKTWEGSQARQAGNTAATGDIIKGIGSIAQQGTSLYSRYGGGFQSSVDVDGEASDMFDDAYNYGNS